MKIRERKYELSTLASIYGIMWAFCSIFANSFADKFPIGDAEDGGYKIYIAIFTAVTVPLSCTSIVDQQWLQMVCVAARF
jgi:amino acid permease